jgi:hypothetical protein
MEMKMTDDVYRYTFDKGTPLSDVRDSLLLAAFSAEGLHGRAQVRLDAAFEVDEKKGVCVVDAATSVGRSIVQIFTSLLAREFGDDAFTVERVAARSSDRVAFLKSGRRGKTRTAASFSAGYRRVAS